MSSNLICAVAWIAGERLKGKPNTASAFTEEELQSIRDSCAADKIVGARLGSAVVDDVDDPSCDGGTTVADTAVADAAAATRPSAVEDDDPFDLAKYDDDVDCDGDSSDVLIESTDERNDEAPNRRNRTLKFAGDQFFAVLERDLMVAAKDCTYGENESDEDALLIRASDYVVLTVNAKREFSTLELNVYDEVNAAFYVHHDIMLSDMPTCVSVLESEGSPSAAVGSMNSLIEIWDLKTLDILEPFAVLKGKSREARFSGKRKTSKKRKDPAAWGHSDAVMSLDVNKFRRELLVSGSADKSAIVWDISTQSPLVTCCHHDAEVQIARWHCAEESLLLTSSYDGTLALVDVRDSASVMKAALPESGAIPVSAVWNPHNSNYCVVSMSSGHVATFDKRRFSTNSSAASPLLWNFRPHEVDCVVALNQVPNLMMTASEDHTAKVWKTDGAVPTEVPQLVTERDLRGGKLLDVQANPHSESLFAFAGSEVVIWDITDANAVCETFGMRS